MQLVLLPAVPAEMLAVTNRAELQQSAAAVTTNTKHQRVRGG